MPILPDAIASIILLPINTVLLWVIVILFKLKDKKLITALKAAAATAVVMFAAGQVFDFLTLATLESNSDVAIWLGLAVLLFLIAVNFTVRSYAIKVFYKEKTKKALLLGLVWLIADGVIGIALGGILLITAFFLSAI